MRAVDTNVIVRLVSADNFRQAQVAETFVARGAWVSMPVIAETVWVLGGVYGFDRQRIAAAVDMLLGTQDLSIQDAGVVASALDLFRSKPSVSFSDCLILELARKAGHLPLGTFDRDLGKLDGAEYLKAAS